MLTFALYREMSPFLLLYGKHFRTIPVRFEQIDQPIAHCMVFSTSKKYSHRLSLSV
jgi:hypothetical protein